jgi:polynucleotide 5'-kinase involved in rRNA processing
MPRRSVPRGHLDEQRTRRDRPGYHDPLAGIGGAAPAQSALTLRLVLAVAGLVFAVAGVVAFVIVEAPGWVLGLFALVAVTAVVDIVVVARRKQRGESG